jgi:hypothetical protein
MLSRNRTLSRNLRERVWGSHTFSRNLRESIMTNYVTIWYVEL